MLIFLLHLVNTFRQNLYMQSKKYTSRCSYVTSKLNAKVQSVFSIINWCCLTAWCELSSVHRVAGDLDFGKLFRRDFIPLTLIYRSTLGLFVNCIINGFHFWLLSFPQTDENLVINKVTYYVKLYCLTCYIPYYSYRIMLSYPLCLICMHSWKGQGHKP